MSSFALGPATEKSISGYTMIEKAQKFGPHSGVEIRKSLVLQRGAQVVARRWGWLGLSVVTLVLIQALSGCAWTSVSSHVLTGYQKHSYGHILVMAQMNLERREQAETRVCERFEDYGVSAIRAIDVMFPGKEYSSEELAKIMQTNGIDGVLILEDGEASESYYYMPKTESTTHSGSWVGNTYYGRSKTTSIGGYSYSKPRCTFSASFVDFQTGDVVWTSFANSRGNAYASQGTLLNSVSDETVQDLVLKVVESTKNPGTRTRTR